MSGHFLHKSGLSASFDARSGQFRQAYLSFVRRVKINKFNELLLGTSALTLVTLGSATAAPVIESGDFGDTFATRTILASQGSVSGRLGGTDLFDYFQLSGFGAGQSIRIVLTQIAQLPDPSASASSSGGTEPSGSEPVASASASTDPSDTDPAASASSSTEPSVSDPAASGSASTDPTASASSSGEPTDVGFTLHLLDETGAFDPLAGDSGPDASGSGSFPDGQVFGNKSFTFDLDTSTLPTGDLNLRLAFDGTGDAFYQVTVTTRSASGISEPSGLIPFAAGAASLGFLAARRRRRKK